MDLKKYFTDEEIKNFPLNTRRLASKYTNKEKLNDGLGMRDHNAEDHWRICDENFSLLGKKTILILPGSGTNSTKQANGMCKIAENLLPEEQKNKWQICSMHYEHSQISDIPTIIRATELLDNYLVPLFSTMDREGELHKIDAKTAAQNMRNVVVFTHCYGGYIEKEIERKMAELMIDIGYTEEERDNIMKQMCVIQHNNIDNKLGQSKIFATHLLRISAADEETSVSDMLYGSFRHYTLSHKIDDSSVAYLKASENVRVLWTDRITQEGVDEHNGGYWTNKNSKSEAGLKEEALFQLIFNEITSSSYLIKDMEQILKFVAGKSDKNKKILSECLQSSINFNADFAEYKDKFIGCFTKLKSKFDDRSLTKTDILQTDEDVCFVEDNNDNFLMDYLLEDKNYLLASTLINKMSPAIPKFVRQGLSGQLDCKNKKDATERINKWAQLAISDNQVDLFKQFITHCNDPYTLDYTQANTKTLSEVIHLVFNKENYMKCPDCLRQGIYVDNLIAVYATTEKAQKNEEISQIQQYIENLLFREDIDIGINTIINAAEKQGSTKLHRMAKNKEYLGKNIAEIVNCNRSPHSS